MVGSAKCGIITPHTSICCASLVYMKEKKRRELYVSLSSLCDRFGAYWMNMELFAFEAARCHAALLPVAV